MKLSRRARWAVPAAGVAATGAVIAGVAVPSAEAAPALPAKTPAQLLALVGSQHAVPPLTGTVVETTSLGLPQLPQTGNPTSLSSLLTGSHTVKVYWQDAKHFRLAVPQNMSETDIIANGSTAWLWESTRNTATKFNLNADNSNKKAGALPANLTPAQKKAIQQKIAAKKAAAKNAQDITAMPLTPQQAANQILAEVGKTTVVSTRTNVTIAGEAAYQLVLAPKDHRSTVGSIVIGIDGKTGVPLEVQVIPKGSSTPAFQVGFTAISYTAPARANFTFTPPAGATVTTPSAGTGAPDQKNGASSQSQSVGTYGSGWISVAELPESDLLGGLGGSSSQQAPGSSPAAGNSSSSAGSMLGGNSQEIVNAILGSGTTVSGSWGSGQLVHTSLLNILITGGKVYVGAVDPSVLEAAVGHTVPAAG